MNVQLVEDGGGRFELELECNCWGSFIKEEDVHTVAIVCITGIIVLVYRGDRSMEIAGWQHCQTRTAFRRHFAHTWTVGSCGTH